MPSEKPEGTVVVADDALVIRFSPTAAESVLRKADIEFRRIGRRGVSVFASVKRLGETDAALKQRLLAVAELDGIRPESNPKFFVCTEATELIRRGFVFYKVGDDDEVDEHYSVDLGADATIEDAERFLGAFGLAERRDQL